MNSNLSRILYGSALVLAAALLLSACGGGAPAPDGAGPDPNADTAVLDADPGEGEVFSADDYYFAGTSLEGVNACELLAVEDIASIVGPLREDETEEEISMAGEAGCKYVDQKGQWYSITYYPLGDWGFAELTLNEAVEVAGLLDGAWKGIYSSDEIQIKALAEGEMVIGAFVSDGQEGTAIRLIELAYQQRPR